MTRTTTGHPTRALAGMAALVVGWITYRLPAMLDAYDAAMRSAIAALPAAAASAAGSPTTGRAADPSPALPANHAPAGGRPHEPRGTRHAPAAPTRPAAAEPWSGTDPAWPALAPAAATVAPASLAATFATEAYARAAAGDRRDAARLFAAAAAFGGDARTAVWAAAAARLRRHWSGSAYSIVRPAGSIDLAVTPVLGGGQTGAALAWTVDPLATRPLALTVRGTAADDATGGDHGAQAAAGIAWRPAAGITVAAERLVALDRSTRDGWTLRLAGGAASTRGRLELAAYGEAGIVDDAVYAAAQARAGLAFALGRRVTIGPAVGAWASIQRAGTSVGRIDAGPGVRLHHAGARLPFDLALDYRFRLAGNAAPGSGPVLTLSTGF
ncbi:MAG: hypothetical protein ACRYG4_13700 [Janthinobacterium lividum]